MATIDTTLRTPQIAKKGIYCACVCGYIATDKADWHEHVVQHYISYAGNIEYLFENMESGRHQ